MTRDLFHLSETVILESVEGDHDGSGTETAALLLTLPKSTHDQAVVLHPDKVEQLTAALLAWLWGGRPDQPATQLAQFTIKALVGWRHGDVGGQEMANLLQSVGIVRAVHSHPAGNP